MSVRFFANPSEEIDFINQANARFGQIINASLAHDAIQRAQLVTEHYQKYPWTNPALADTFSRWKSSVGEPAAKGLARHVYAAMTAPDATRKSVQDAQEEYMMTGEYRRRVDAGQEQPDFWDELTDIVVKPVTAPYRFGKAVVQGDVGGAAGAAFDFTPIGVAKETLQAGAVGVGDIPGVGPAVKGTSRAVFTGLESPWQEIQAGATRLAVSGLSAVGAQPQWGPGQGDATGVGSVKLAGTSNFGRQINDVSSQVGQRLASGANAAQSMGLTVGNAPWEPVSTGAIALGNLLGGKKVDLGTGWFPGGDVYKEHVDRVQSIAYFTYGKTPSLDADGKPRYDKNGLPIMVPEKHFATPGRIVAATVLEPGTRPYTALSGTVDAGLILSSDPVNKALGELGALNKARNTFNLSKVDEAVQAAGGFKGTWNAWTHGPSVNIWSEGDDAQRIFNWAGNAGTKDFVEIAKRFNWKLPKDTVLKLIDATSPDEARDALLPVMGAEIAEIPDPWSIGAHIRTTLGTKRLFNLRPERVIDLDHLDGPQGALNQIYRSLKNEYATDSDISKGLEELARSTSRPGNYEGLKTSMTIGEEALVKRGVPREIARAQNQLFAKSLEDGSLYHINQVGTNIETPMILVDGTEIPFGQDKPQLLVEFLGSKVVLPDPYAMDRMVAKYGRVLGISGTGAGDMASRARALERQIGKAADWGSLDAEQRARALAIDPDAENLVGKIKLARTTGEQGRLGPDVFGPPITPLQIKSGLHAAGAALEHLQSQIWVPLQLIRGAWTLRVIGEEQLRMMAAGVENMWHHPISHIGAVIASRGRTADAWRGAKGASIKWTDALAQDLIDTTDYQAAMAGSASGTFGMASGQRLIASGRKVFDPSMGEDYTRAWANELIKLHTDPVMGNLAKRLVAGVSQGREGEFDNVLDQVKQDFWDGKLAWRTRKTGDPVTLVDGAPKTGLVPWDVRKDLLDSKHWARWADQFETPRQASDAYIDLLHTRLQETTGSHGELIDFVSHGKYGNEDVLKPMLNQRVKMPSGMADQEGTVVSRSGKNSRVLFDGAEQTVLVPNSELKMVEPGAAEGTHPRAHDGVGVDTSFTSWLDQLPEEIKPGQMAGEVFKTSKNPVGVYDSAVSHFFSFLMAKPSNWLSRSVTFRANYWQHGETLMSEMTHEAQVAFAEQANNVGLSRAVTKRINEAVGKSAGNLTLEDADTIAKGFALDKTRELLYDLNRRSQFFDATKLLFPFGEAWKEVITRWPKIIAENPRVLRRFQVGVTGLQEANPFAVIPGAVPDYRDPHITGNWSGSGFFYTDPRTGQQAFAYPWSQDINAARIGVPIPFTGQAKSLNLAFNVMPGIGPVVQFGAHALMSRWMQSTKFDPIRDVLFPYGEPDTKAGFWEYAPAWMKKMATGSEMGGPDDTRDLNNTTAQLYAYGVANNDYNPHGTEARLRRDWDDAYEKAKNLWLTRGSFQFGAPAAPSPEFIVKSKQGMLQIAVLRDEYFRLTNDKEGGGYDTAAARFIKMYGEKAFYAVAPMTVSKAFEIPSTKDQAKWARDHPGIVDAIPHVYGFFTPHDPNAPFDYNTYLRSIHRTERVSTTDSVEWVRRSNNVLGTVHYDRFLRKELHLGKDETMSEGQATAARLKRNQIRRDYPGFRDVPDVAPNRVPHAIDELRQATRNKDLQQQSPALVGAISEYDDLRIRFIAQAAAQGRPSEWGSPAYATSGQYQWMRSALHSEGIARLMADTPEFEAVWDQVYSHEFKEQD